MGAVMRLTFVGLLVATLNLGFTAKHTASQLVSTGQTVVLDGQPYYVPASPLTTVKARRFRSLPSAGGLVPVTVVDSMVNLQATFQAYEKADDIWSIGFLEGNACLHRSLFLLFVTLRVAACSPVLRFLHFYFVWNYVLYIFLDSYFFQLRRF